MTPICLILSSFRTARVPKSTDSRKIDTGDTSYFESSTDNMSEDELI